MIDIASLRIELEDEGETDRDTLELSESTPKWVSSRLNLSE